jgi:hypothetical protein
MRVDQFRFPCGTIPKKRKSGPVKVTPGGAGPTTHGTGNVSNRISRGK